MLTRNQGIKSIVMKFSLGKLLKRNKSSADPADVQSMPELIVDAKPTSLGKIRLQLLVTGVLLLALLAMFILLLVGMTVLRRYHL